MESTFFRTFFEAAIDPLAIVGMDGVVRAANPAWTRTLGWLPEEIVGRPYLDHVHPDDLPATQKAADELAENKSLIGFTNRWKTKDGGWRDLQWNAVICPSTNLIYATVRDVTEDRSTTVRLSEIEAVSGIGSWEAEFETGRLYWSPQTCRIHEVPEDYVPDLNGALAFFPPESRATVEAAFRKLTEDGVPYDVEATFVTARGHHRWVRATGAAEFRAGRLARAYGTFQDVTEQHETRDRLELLSSVAARTTNPVLITDKDARIVWANAAFERRSGWTMDEVRGKRPDEFLHSAEVPPERSRQLIEAARGGREIRTEITHLSKSGQVYWVDLDVQPRFDAAGRLVGCITVQTDITERKALEAALAEEKNRLQATLRAVPDLLFEMDEQGRFIGYHPGLDTTTLVPAELFLGRTLEEVMPPHVAILGREAMSEVDADGRSSTKRYRLDLDGEARWFDLRATSRAIGAEDDHKGYLFHIRDVSEQVDAEERLHYRERLLESLFDLSPIGIALNDAETGLFLDANEALLSVLSRSRDDMLRRTFAEVTPPEFRRIDAAAASQLQETGRYGPVEKELLLPGGRRVPAVLNGMLIKGEDGRDLIWSLVEDVRERRERELRLRAAEREAVAARERLLTAVENLPDGFVFYDAEDRLVIANTRYKEIYAESAPAMVEGASFESVLRYGLDHGQYAEAIGREEEWLKDRLWKHHHPGKMIEQRLGNGRVLRIFERKTPDGGSVGLRVDVTELYEARERAEEASRAKSLFLANMSHEIRTPLNGILGMADILGSELTDPAKRDLARTIRESGETLLTILNDLLDMSKIEAGKMELEQAPFVPSEIARRVEALHALRAQEKGLGFDLLLDEGANGHRLGDAHRVTQILHNLLSNAVKFTEHGHIVLQLSAPKGAPVTIFVEDTGIGMTAEQCARIFDDFEQADRSVTRRYGGTGLGMSIVRRLVQLMGGTISLESEPGRGTSVSVTLPLPEHVSAPVHGRQIEAGEGLSRLHGLRALIADDNPINLQILRAFLGKLGIDSTMAENGRAAVEAYQDGRFDILCFDISMPELDGVHALAEIDAIARRTGLPRPPALAVTANAMPHQVLEYRAAGFEGHLAKPLRRDEVGRAILSVLPETRPT